MNFTQELSLIRSSRQVHSKWYLKTYPEVAALGLDPAAHYLRYGAAMGRNPGNSFNTRFYLEAHPDAVESGLNPLIHYVLHGRDRGYPISPPKNHALNQHQVIRNKLLSLGFTERPLEEFREVLEANSDPQAQALAARELALWCMREKTDEGYRTALKYNDKARAVAPDLDFRSKLATAELLCHYFLNNREAGRAAYNRAALVGEGTSDLLLAWANFQPTPEGRIVWINQALANSNISPVALMPDEGKSPYDRLTSAIILPAVTGGPKVTVLIAAYDAAEVLPTALRALQEQTWKNLEILVIDDCSPTSGTCEVAERFAAADPRIRLIRMKQNGGAYVARNCGLDEATGEYITLHDADDWSHPQKIEAQMNHLAQHPELIGSFSAQARAQNDLTFSRWTGAGVLINTNISSFLWRRDAVREKLGYWDAVRFSADSELIRRVRRVFGAHSIDEIAQGPMSFQRDSASSIIADDIMGMNGFYFGARREYVSAQLFHHRRAKDLRYDNDPSQRPFPAPPMMLPERKRLTSGRHFALIVQGDFRVHDAKLDALIERLRRMRAEGQRIGLLEAPVYRHPTHDHLPAVHPVLRDEVDGDAVQVIVFGDDVSCDALELFGGADLSADTRYRPEIRVKQPE